MGHPQRKESPESPELKIVPSEHQPDTKESRSLSFFFLVAAALGATTVIYFAQQSAHSPLSLQGVYEWHMNLDANGTSQFPTQKQQFREKVKKNLSAKQASVEATGLALYLFPELLADTDFQKHEALELWVPHQKQIEAAPGTLESRIQFERMRSNVWNFETADKQSPILTEPARQMLRVYDQLSRPR